MKYLTTNGRQLHTDPILISILTVGKTVGAVIAVVVTNHRPPTIGFLNLMMETFPLNRLRYSYDCAAIPKKR